MAYQVKLEVFEGPFDLLLQLISRRKLDVTEVDLAEITADFLAHLEVGIEELDLETATRFLVVAATLIELKAARLLPRDEGDELEDLLGDARDLLYARLLEYRAFRDVSRILAHRITMHDSRLGREVPPEPWMQRLVPETPLSVDAAGLAAIAASALAPATEAPVDLSHIRRSYITIREAATDLLERLGGAGEGTTFRELVAERDRGDRVVFFLALLELFKLGHVDLDQPDHRGPLAISRREGGQDLQSLTEPDDPDDDGEASPSPDEPSAMRGVS
ncbi:MAG TPA: ScpA family protein [Egicoccus sp.]|nr:ScpA family protein [Egicoccus sp.]HSK24540.1 ScpA family protein [Egicoccus sp.]